MSISYDTVCTVNIFHASEFRRCTNTDKKQCLPHHYVYVIKNVFLGKWAIIVVTNIKELRL